MKSPSVYILWIRLSIHTRLGGLPYETEGDAPHLGVQILDVWSQMKYIFRIFGNFYGPQTSLPEPCSDWSLLGLRSQFLLSNSLSVSYGSFPQQDTILPLTTQNQGKHTCLLLAPKQICLGAKSKLSSHPINS